MRAAFEECRTSKGTAKEGEILGSDRLGRRDGKTIVEGLADWLENGIAESYIGSCSWGPENEHGGSKEGSLNVTNLSDEDMTQARRSAGETRSRSWERLHHLGVVTETTTVCLPNLLSPDFSIEDHLFECLEWLKCWLSVVQEIHVRGTQRPHGMDNMGTRPCLWRSSEWGFLTGGGREAGGGSRTNGAKERADVGDGDGINGDRLVFSPGDRSPRGDLTGRTVSRPPGF